MCAHFAFIDAMTQLVPLDDALAARAGETVFLMKTRLRDWPLADSIIYATARELAAQLVTGDPHFRPIKEIRTEWP